MSQDDTVQPSLSETKSLLEDELMANGRRYLVCNNYQLATQAFQEVCQIMTDKYGELSSQLAEPYYLYGKSLLELARQESNVLGGGVPVPNEQEQEESSEEEEGEGEEEEGEETSSNTEEAPSTTDKATPTTNEAPPTNDDDDDDKDVGTLQLAWEMFEVTRLICQKDPSQESQLLLADVCMLLGEVGLESDLYDQAIDDFTTCLQVREAILSPHDRKLAEGHFNLGLTHSLAKRHHEAIAEYECTKQILDLRIEKLQTDVEKSSHENKQKLLDEIKDIESLLPEIESKISEEISQIDEKEKQETLEGEEEENSYLPGLVSSSTSSAKEVTNADTVTPTDISHLVRKKKTTVPAPVSSDQGATTNGECNGDHLNDNEAIPAKRKRSMDHDRPSTVKRVALTPLTVEAPADSTTSHLT